MFPSLQEFHFGVCLGFYICFVFKFLSTNFSLLIRDEVRKQFQVANVIAENFTWTMTVHDLGWKTQIWYRTQTVLFV